MVRLKGSNEMTTALRAIALMFLLTFVVNFVLGATLGPSTSSHGEEQSAHIIGDPVLIVVNGIPL